MNKVKGRQTKEWKGREKLELGAFLSGGVDLQSRGFRKIFCFSCSVFIYLFFFSCLSPLFVVHWSAGQACHISTLLFTVLLGSTVGWHVVAGAKFSRRHEGVLRLLVKQCHWDWHLERLWKMCFVFFLHFFCVFPTTEQPNTKTSYFEYTDDRNGV